MVRVLVCHARSRGFEPRFPLCQNNNAGVAELADAQDLKSCGERSEEHTSELQSLDAVHLVCRLLLEKKNKPIFLKKEERVRPPRENPILSRKF